MLVCHSEPVEDVLRGVVVAVEAQIDVVGGGLLQSYVDGSVAYEGLIQYIAHVLVETFEEWTAAVAVLIDDVAWVAVGIVPYGDVESNAAVLVGQGVVEVEVKCGKCVLGVEGKATGKADGGVGGGDAVAVFGCAVVVGIVVVEGLGEGNCVVLRIGVAADTFAQVMGNIECIGTVVAYGQRVVEGWTGMRRRCLVGVGAPVDRRVLIASVV